MIKMFYELDACPRVSNINLKPEEYIKVKLINLEENSLLKHFFNKTEGVEQIENVTPAETLHTL